MKVTFVSNYINHHQLPVSRVLYENLGENYHFIQTEPMEEERVQMGWGSDYDKLPFLLKYYSEEETCKKLISESDVVIFGGCDDERYIEARLEEKKPVIRYSERLYKEGQWKWISPRGLKKKYHDHTRYSKDRVYLLCSGAYVQDDFHLIHAYKGKMFNWGYFPEFVEYDKSEREAGWEKRKNHSELQILWAGRFLDWKHPESVIELAKILSEKGVPFHITVIGDGAERSRTENGIAEQNLNDKVEFVGSKKPNEVRDYMRASDVFLMTSDYKEGWGAVCNEAMNSECVLVASHAAGAVPTLVKHRENGMIFQSGHFDEMASLVEELSKDYDLRYRLGTNAYETLASEWNHKVAGERLLQMCEQILGGEVKAWESGPLSEAKVIRQNRMYQYLVGDRK
ncbi:MAG: glycosyltransferase family 4 protein [Lachnospiraceae bacterium]|nr:glycosyltransferase family 4 protein [Lachnospiraceae bacterium]